MHITGRPVKAKYRNLTKAVGLAVSVPNKEFFEQHKTIDAKRHAEIEIHIDGLYYTFTRSQFLKLVQGLNSV
jgi:hypothetical protein